MAISGNYEAGVLLIDLDSHKPVTVETTYVSVVFYARPARYREVMVVDFFAPLQVCESTALNLSTSR